MTFLRQGQAACAMNMPATDGSDENAQLLVTGSQIALEYGS